MADDRRNRTCPKCGTGVLPEAVFCIRCGAELPPMAPDPERVARQHERRQVEHVTWFLDLFPGVLSRDVVIGSVIVIAIGAALGVAYVVVSCAAARAGGAGCPSPIVSMAETFIAVAIGCGAAGALACGLTWLMYGEMCFPPLAWVDFRARHWVAFLTLLLPVVVGFVAVACFARALPHGR